MATDARVLLQGLQEYSRALERHTVMLKIQFHDLDSHWHQFSSVYEGDAADQFRAGWIRTSQNFTEYIEQTDRIQRILEERIAALREADRTESGLIG
ncbi:MAG TPA: WXG100 family type VII secretion target [Pyrinomonadaceae bacterium]|nr:WXG100 family type VII secretion target [Pyrinomonadaceae bacterium]